MRAHLSWLPALTAAAPQLAFPFNSQVPPVARVSQPYDFRLAEATFTSSVSNITYELVGGPRWLKIDGNTRQLYGTPAQDDIGPQLFTIKATDRSGIAFSAATILVSNQAPPTIQQNITTQLQTTKRLSAPGILPLVPGDSFVIALASDDTFQRGDAPILTTYATLADRAPLPAWLQFNPRSSKLSGVAPKLVAQPLEIAVVIIASDIVGFAGVEQSFTIRVAQHQLSFEQQRQAYTTTAGSPVNISLASQLYVDDAQITPTSLSKVTLVGPQWLTLNPTNLQITGTAPTDFEAAEASVIVQTSDGTSAVKTLDIESSALPTDGMSKVNNLTVVTGQEVNFAPMSNSSLAEGIRTSAVFQPSQSWLSYNSTTRRITGLVPNDSASISIQVKISSEPSNTDSSTVSFFLNIRNLGRPNADQGQSSSRQSTLSEGAIIGLAVGLSLVGLIPLLVICICCCKRRRQREPQEKIISRPMLTVENNHDLARIIEEDGESEILASPTKKKRASNRSSLANGDSAIEADGNIPTWGQSFDERRRTKDGYSAIWRMSSSAKINDATKRTSLQILPNRHSHISVGQTSGKISHQASARYAGQQPIIIEKLDGTDHFADHNNRLGSASRLSAHSPSKLRATLQQRMSASNRNSIRLVPRSDSMTERRSFSERRQSYIRNRASSMMPSPLFSHASRGPTVSPPSYISNQETRQHVRQSQQFPSGADEHVIETVELPAHDHRSSRYSVDSSGTHDAEQWRSQLALARHQRAWVLPGEASPTPPPQAHTSPPGSVIVHPFLSKGRSTKAGRTSYDNREAVRRMWAQKLGRNSRGQLRSSSSARIQTGSSEFEIIHPHKTPEVREPLGTITNGQLAQARTAERKAGMIRMVQPSFGQENCGPLVSSSPGGGSRAFI